MVFFVIKGVSAKHITITPLKFLSSFFVSITALPVPN